MAVDLNSGGYCGPALAWSATWSQPLPGLVEGVVSGNEGSAKPPLGLDPSIKKRTFKLQADAKSLARMRKEGSVQGFQVFCDENPITGGDSSAPTPLGYLCLALAF